MSMTKIAITIDQQLLAELDRLIANKQFPNRSRAVQEAVRDKVLRLKRTRLAQECAKLNPGEERAMAEEGLAADCAQWPEY